MFACIGHRVGAGERKGSFWCYAHCERLRAWCYREIFQNWRRPWSAEPHVQAHHASLLMSEAKNNYVFDRQRPTAPYSIRPTGCHDVGDLYQPSSAVAKNYRKGELALVGYAMRLSPGTKFWSTRRSKCQVGRHAGLSCSKDRILVKGRIAAAVAAQQIKRTPKNAFHPRFLTTSVRGNPANAAPV
jgi:hypothetical protein